jgi:hypothetical protein
MEHIKSLNLLWKFKEIGYKYSSREISGSHIRTDEGSSRQGQQEM